jgi:hypothetical protein
MIDGWRLSPAQIHAAMVGTGGRDLCFRVYDATGFSSVRSRIAHARSFRYGDNQMRREDARRVAKAIS